MFSQKVNNKEFSAPALEMEAHSQKILFIFLIITSQDLIFPEWHMNKLHIIHTNILQMLHICNGNIFMSQSDAN